ncbi:nuclear transport factor 2 family protein [Nocardia fusca]|uniref:nuclear transport factor 2 family protein n=1 Tax=Nocardia fusca TaxID=941183 RepID=UPI0037CC7D17
MCAADHKRVVLEVLSAFETGDVEAVLSRMADDVTWWVAGELPMSGEFGKSQIPTMMAGIDANTVGDVVFRPVNIIAEKNRVAVEAESTANLTNGRLYTNKYHFAFEFDGDLISAVREYMDTLRVHQLMFS